MRFGLSNRRQRKRASHFSCLCKKSNQKNTPPRDRPSGKPWPDLLQPGRPDTTSCCGGTKWAIPGPFTRLPQASPRRSQGGPSLRPRLSNNSAPDEGFPGPPWRRHGRGCGDRVGRSGPGHGLPEGRLRGGGPFFGTFLWASKERYSPARDAGRSKCAACGGRNSVQACPLAFSSQLKPL